MKRKKKRGKIEKFSQMSFHEETNIFIENII